MEHKLELMLDNECLTRVTYQGKPTYEAIIEALVRVTEEIQKLAEVEKCSNG